jgi:hypothetical protein
MLALVAAVEATVLGLRDDLIGPLGEGWRMAALDAEAKAPGCDVLCFGDSLVKYGVLPREIEARTGLKAYNLATSGGTTASAYFLLKRALHSGAKPRAVVVDFAALMPVTDAPQGLLNYPELATPGDCLELAEVVGDPSFFGASMVAKALPSARFRHEIRGAVLASLAGRSTSERASVDSHRRIWARERGAQPTVPGRAYHPREPELIEALSPEGWTCPPADLAFIERFLSLAGSRGIAVRWLLPPMAPGVRDRRLARGADEAYGRFARSLAARHPGVMVLDARASGYDDSVHIDHLHLDERGALALSDDVAATLIPSSPRSPASWVDLPLFAGRSGGEPGSKSPPGLASSRTPADARPSQGVNR